MTACIGRSLSSILRYLRRTFSAVLAGLAALLFTVSLPVYAEVKQQEITLPAISEIVCQSYIVYNRTKSEVVLSFNPDQKIYPASMTKIMTASLALDTLASEQTIAVSKTAMGATTPNSTMMGLMVDEQMSVSELLYGLLLPSGNDAANVLAEEIVKVTGYKDPVNQERSKLDLFSDIMNKKAAELGLSNTHFVNANGLHDNNHYTTASELARLFDYALQYNDFRTVIESPTHVFKATNKHSFDAWKIVKNTNSLLTDPWILGTDTNIAKIAGGKTGTTIPAGTGMTLLSINKNGDELISVVCGIPYEDANRLNSYMAAILNEGAKECFLKDPVVRVTGNVMDNKPENSAASFKPSVTAAASPAPEQSLTPAASADAAGDSTVTPAAGKDSDEDKSDPSASGSFPINLLTEHPVISIAVGAVILVAALLVVVYFIVNKKRRRGYNGIRRI